MIIRCVGCNSSEITHFPLSLTSHYLCEDRVRLPIPWAGLIVALRVQGYEQRVSIARKEEPTSRKMLGLHRRSCSV
jgi:hypothetical protein